MTPKPKEAKAVKPAAHRKPVVKRASASKPNAVLQKTVAPAAPKREPYTQAHGGRKTASAMARVFEHKSGLSVNGKPYTEYFRFPPYQSAAIAPLRLLKLEEHIGGSVMVHGGGIAAQADAVSNAIARALVKLKPETRKNIKIAGLLTRDSRAVERKKPGLRKARRAPQWSKR